MTNAEEIRIITPILRLDTTFEKTLISLCPQLKTGDLWTICIDSSSQLVPSSLIEFFPLLKQYISEVHIIKSNSAPGAGNTRNYALEEIIARDKASGCLMFLDADDEYHSHFLELARSYFTQDHPVVSFSYNRVHSSGRVHSIVKDAVVPYGKFVFSYGTSCLSTIVFLSRNFSLDGLRFGCRKRANDQLFFLNAAKKAGSVLFVKDIVADYKVGNPKSLSGRMFLMPYYKFLALCDHGLGKPLIFKIMIFYLGSRLISRVTEYVKGRKPWS